MFTLKGEGISGEKIRGSVAIAGSPSLDSVNIIPSLSVQYPSAHSDHFSGNVVVVPAGCMGLLQGLLKTPAISALILSERPGTLYDSIDRSGITCVSGISSEYFRNGDNVVVDGLRGTVEIQNVLVKEAVGCVVQSGGRTLILRRSEKVGSFQGKWACVSGYMEEGDSPEAAAIREVSEELSIQNPIPLKRGEPVIARKDGIVWISHPFLFRIEEEDARQMKIDWEHTDYRWIGFDELRNYDTVPNMTKLISALGLS